MKENKALKELVANISDWKTRQIMAPKPFKPCFLDIIISPLAPQLYSEEELTHVKNFQMLLSRVLTESESTENTKSKKRKRCKEIKDVPKEERVMPKKKESRSIIMPKLGTAAPDLGAEFKNRIAELNGGDIKYLLYKKLFKSDLERNNNRLSMPLNKFMCDFLTAAEKANLEEREGARRRPQGLEITVLDPMLREFSMQLKKWKMNCTDIYNLVRNWNDVVSANDFKKDQELHIWSFRVHGNLYLLLCKL
ncbi:hypothetical protein VNO77_40875 [Canavalia gladiata]|uniref:B3 domain-containing protein n=1 Tax=Canavalia gladiata TaxID=3824 RepID=A0AAN9K072_CANGL